MLKGENGKPKSVLSSMKKKITKPAGLKSDKVEKP